MKPIFVLVGLLAVGACEQTTYGVGKDMQRAGEKISDWSQTPETTRPYSPYGVPQHREPYPGYGVEPRLSPSEPVPLTPYQQRY